MPTSVATANLLFRLSRTDAARALRTVLAEEPDLVGLQEWYVSRTDLLRRTGDVLLVPSHGLLRLPAGRPGYHWVATIGAGCAVGARTDRFDLVEGRSVLLSGLGRAERDDYPFGAEPPRIAALGIFRDREVDRTIALISYHFVAGAQTGGAYRADRPLLVARHRQEVRRVEALVADLQQDGHTVYAVGDANFHLLPLTGLTSSWTGREDGPATIGPGTRKIDDVHGPGPATSVRLISTPSDHRAVIAVRPD
ncbi:MAG: hypothetical protein NTV23_08210 [Propionibacteriales bacterium]|nr:hypothetical protein [Propionibacteriales bacterium]